MSKVPNTELSLSEKINGKLEFSYCKRATTLKTLLCGHFFAKLTLPLRLEGPKTLDRRFLSQMEPPSAATRLAGVVARPPSPTLENLKG
jgi:hypothetical protein